MPPPETVLVLDVADQHSLDRSVHSVLEAGRTATVVDPTAGDDLVSSLVSAARQAHAAEVVTLCAGELLRIPPVPASGPPLAEGLLVPHPFGPAGARRWSLQDPPRWADWVFAAPARGHDLAGAPAVPNASARVWLREVVHRRERARGAALPEPADSVFESLCLAWAGEHDAALARAMPCALGVAAPDHLRVAAARIATVAAAAIRRPDEAVQALNVLWAAQPSASVSAWAGALAALAPQHISTIAPLLGQEGPFDVTRLEPWLGRAIDASWRAAAIDSEATARRLLAAVQARGRVDSADEVLQIWRLWRGTRQTMAALVEAWPGCARDALRIVLEQAWQLEPPHAWDELARAYSATHGPTQSLLAAAASLADVLPLESLISWETLQHRSRVRAESPLLRRSADEGTPPVDAAFAAAIAVQAGLGQPAERALVLAVRRLLADEPARVAELVRAAAPKAEPVLLAALRAEALGAELQ